MTRFIKNKTFYIFIILFYIISRFYVLFILHPDASDVQYYAKIAFESKIASKINQSFYDVHEHVNKTQVEYPPLAIKWIELPNLFINQDINFIPKEFDVFLSKYIFLYRLFSALLELGTFILFINYLFSRKYNLAELTEKSLIFILGGLSLLHVLYDRLDIILGCLILCSLILLLKRKYLWSFFLLALSINFKIVPIILIPIWLIGSLPDHLMIEKFDRKNFKKIIYYIFRQLGIILLFIIILFVPFLLISGKNVLGFLSFHLNRGIQVESIYSSIILIINLFYNVNAQVIGVFGGFNLNSNLSDFFMILSSIILSVLLIFSILLLIFYLLSVSKIFQKQKNKSSNLLAFKFPDIFICYTIFFIIISISASKVFSPQYLLWLVPIFPLISYKKILFRISSWIFVLTCIITTVIFPYLYFTDIITGPTLLGASLLIIRNILVIFLVVIFIVELIKEVKTKEWLSIV